MDKYRQHRQPPHIEEVARPRPIWTTWTIRTTYEREQPPRPCGALHAPRVCIYNRYREAESLNAARIWTIWTTWTTEHRHARRCVSVFAPLCVHIYKGHQSHHPPRIGVYIDKRPAEGVQLSRPPDMNDTDNEGKASTDEKETDPDTDKYRQHGQPPAALRLYTTHKNGRPLRIENGRKIITSKYGQPPTAACKYTPIYLHAAKIRKTAHKTESQRSKEERPAEGVQRPHSPP